MAPEQIQTRPCPASDQYALGIVVYEWLSGDLPFDGSFTEIAIKQMLVPPPPLREKVPAILPDVEHVVMTALAKDPGQRFKSIQAFAQALEQASQGELPTVASSKPDSSHTSPLPSISAVTVIPEGEKRVSTLDTNGAEAYPVAKVSNEKNNTSVGSHEKVLAITISGTGITGIGVRWVAAMLLGIAIYGFLMSRIDLNYYDLGFLTFHIVPLT